MIILKQIYDAHKNIEKLSSLFINQKILYFILESFYFDTKKLYFESKISASEQSRNYYFKTKNFNFI